ncbi:MAG: zinc ribbon domain-containing protein [Solirubrobacteraceae bacterium]
MVSWAVFGINNSGVNTAVDLLIVFLAMIWLALVYWTYADARLRILDPLLVGAATAAALFPFVGTVIYMIIRPPEYLDDVRERELEMQASEARLAELGYHLCPHCDYEVEKDFLRCPSCQRKLKDPCQACGRPLDPLWKICPFCEAEIGAAPSAPRRARRRRDGTAEQPIDFSEPGAAARAGLAEPAPRADRGLSEPGTARAERGGPTGATAWAPRDASSGARPRVQRGDPPTA